MLKKKEPGQLHSNSNPVVYPAITCKSLKPSLTLPQLERVSHLSPFLFPHFASPSCFTFTAA